MVWNLHVEHHSVIQPIIIVFFIKYLNIDYIWICMVLTQYIYIYTHICCIYFPPSNSGKWTLHVDPINPWTPKALLKRCFWGSDTCSACVWISREYVRHITLLNLNRLLAMLKLLILDFFSHQIPRLCQRSISLDFQVPSMFESSRMYFLFGTNSTSEKKRVKIELGTPNLSIHFFFWLVYVYIYNVQKVSIYIYIFIFAQYALPYSGATPSLPATRYLREKSQNRKSPKYIYLHLFPYTTQINNLGIHRPAADFCIDFLFWKEIQPFP